MRRWLGLLLLVALVLSSCEYKEETRETGHKGRARANPYLAAERFLQEYGYPTGEGLRWPKFDYQEAMVVAPLSVLESVGRVDTVKSWVSGGGHLVVLLRDGEAGLDDWSTHAWNPPFDPEAPHAFATWLERAGMEIQTEEKKSTDSIRFDGDRFEVFMESDLRLEKGRYLLSKSWGDGRITAVSTAEPFRNRYIGDYDHAELLLALANVTGYEGQVIFLRFASESFWALIWEKAWPFLVALLVLTALWLWRNLPRFGPVDSHESSKAMLASDHHLEALGGFHWDLDHGRGLLAPLRESLMERAHRFAIASGRQDDDLFQVIAERADLTRERAERAMTIELTRDSASFTRLTADLQQIHHSLP
ncbi:DUF4350 domain-containing protein [Haloferula sargassicola]|uniref:DUF4350 domain-containing protein n=1 Tax=Haloferula sargassicola TaxID=490096 RepID=A0ABP9UK34_9BACT